VLGQAELDAVFCPDLAGLCREMEARAGTALLAEEALDPPALHALVGVLNRQEAWSDFPLVVLFGRVGTAESGLRMLGVLEPLGHVTVLERPVRTMALVSALRAALRARRRQYEVRDLLRQREEVARDADEFVTLLAHELRTPVGAIRNAAHVLGEVDSPGALAIEQRALIERQTGRLARLIDGVLEGHRLLARRVSLRRRPVDLAVVLASAVQGVRAADGPAPAFVPPPAPLPVEADAEQLGRAFSQLLAEAASCGRGARVSAAREGGEAVVRVTEVGAAWPAEGAAWVPARLTDVIRLLDRPDGCLAVGLLLVRSLVEHHGGRVAVSPGGDLEVRLPLQAGVAAPAGVAKAAPAAAARRRVLVVEDNRDARLALRRVLQLWGHEVETAEDGREAVERAGAARPEVALVDIGLPGLDGYGVARQLRASLGRDVVLVAVTGYGEPHDRRRALEAGFDAHFVKPLTPETLRELLARAVPSGGGPSPMGGSPFDPPPAP
jgi:CheY-like chemotaxis protein/signal transduction histidine kinase